MAALRRYAIAQYEPMREHYPDDISNLVVLGQLYIVTGQYAKSQAGYGLGTAAGSPGPWTDDWRLAIDD